jgi:hypothetical protein
MNRIVINNRTKKTELGYFEVSYTTTINVPTELQTELSFKNSQGKVQLSTDVTAEPTEKETQIKDGQIIEFNGTESFGVETTDEEVMAKLVEIYKGYTFPTVDSLIGKVYDGERWD